jgi:hypothetical protein
MSTEDADFDEERWEDLINSDEVFDEQFSKSINPLDNSSVISNKNDLVKLSVNGVKRSSFINSNKFFRTGQSLTILIPPSPNQRVRYENECKKVHRYISIPNNKTLTIQVDENFENYFSLFSFNRSLIFVIFLLLVMFFGCV